MEDLCDLLFELSNEDRLRILHELEQRDLRLSHVAKKLDFTVQETTRKVARLVKAKLVTRVPSGAYEVTSMGIRQSCSSMDTSSSPNTPTTSLTIPYQTTA